MDTLLLTTDKTADQKEKYTKRSVFVCALCGTMVRAEADTNPGTAQLMVGLSAYVLMSLRRRPSNEL
jgi:hypothetical protein